MHRLRRIVGTPDHLLAVNPFLPDGGDGTDGGTGGGAGGTGQPATGGAGTSASTSGGDGQTGGVPAGPHGYPENTPLAEMTVDQREAYWKHQARKHEASAKDAARTIAELKPRADQYAALEAASRTEQERAVENARREAAAAAKAETEAVARRTYGTAIVTAEFRAALAGKRTTEQVTALVGALDVTRFLNDDGTANATAIEEYAKAVTAGEPQARTTPDLGQGRRGTTKTSGLEAGRDLYAQRHPARRTT